MPITFKSERKKLLKQMYNDMCDAYVENAEMNKRISPEHLEEIRNDAEEWKTEFRILMDDL